MTSVFKDLYFKKLRSQLTADLDLKNLHQSPRLEKIVLNAGVKEAAQDGKVLNTVVDGLTRISGQKVVKTTAKKSIAGFKIREGVAIGAKVTLRGGVMYDFIEKLIKVVLPSVRDFRGVKAQFDGGGNYNLGIKDWMVFPEIDYDNFPSSKGFNITFHISNGNSNASLALLKGFGMPFAEKGK